MYARNCPYKYNNCSIRSWPFRYILKFYCASTVGDDPTMMLLLVTSYASIVHTIQTASDRDSNNSSDTHTHFSWPYRDSESIVTEIMAQKVGPVFIRVLRQDYSNICESSALPAVCASYQTNLMVFSEIDPV